MDATPDPQVQWAQGCLAQNDPSVPQDGLLGPRTRQAIRAFQAQQQLPSTGVLDPGTVTALQSNCGGADQQQPSPPAGPPAPPPPPPPGAGPRPPRQHEIGSGFQQEGEFRRERPFFDFHREDRFRGDRFREDRFREERDRRWPWLFETAPGDQAQGEFRPGQPFFDFRREDRFRGDRFREDRFREDRFREERDRRWPWFFETAPADQQEFRPDRPFEFRREERFRGDRFREDRDGRRRDRDRRGPFFLREVEGEIRPERPVFRPVEVHPREGFPLRSEGFTWDRHRRGFRPFGERPWGFGVRGEERMRWAQSCLAQLLGSWVIQDGAMGPNTEAALRKFQKQQQLPITGVLDEATDSALHAACGR